MPYTATNRLDIIGSQVVSAGLTIGEVAQGSEATVGLRVLVANQTERLVVDNAGTTISSGDLSLSAGKVSASTFSIPSGLTGATAASRYVGATATGAPVGGSFVVGDWVISQAGSIYIYTSQGWTQVSGGGGGGGGVSLSVANTWTATQTFSSGAVVSAGGMAIGTTIDNDVPLKIGTVTATGQIGLNLSSNTGAHLQLTDIYNVDMSLGVLDGQSALSFHTGRNRLSAGTELMRLSSAGNLGINTTSPNAKLDVKGNIRLTASTSGYTEFAVGSTTASITYTLPSSAPTSGYVLSSTDTGTMSWLSNSLSVNGKSIALGGSATLVTDDVAEAVSNPTNLYFTTARARAAFSQGTGVTITDGAIAIGQAVSTTSNVTFNDVTVSGNLTVSGTTTQVNSTVTTIVDPIIDIGGAANGASLTIDDSKDRGITFQWHNGTAAKRGFFGWDRSVQRFSFIPDATITSEVVSGTLGNIDVTTVFASTGLVIDSLNGISSLGSAGDHKAYLGFMSPGNNNWTTTDLVYTYENGSIRTVPYLSRTSTWTATQTFSNATSAILGSGDGTGTITGGLLRAPSGTGTNIAGGSLTIAGGASTGTGAGGAIIFQTAPAGTTGATANALATRMRIADNGAVLVGSIASSTVQYSNFDGQGKTLLEIAATGTYTGTGEDYGLPLLAFSTNALGPGSALPSPYAGTIAWTLRGTASNDKRLGLIGMQMDANSTASPSGFMTFLTAGTSGLGERMRITSTGNVGIGTTSPGRALHVVGNSGRASSTGLAWNYNSAMILDNNSETFLSFYANSANQSGILFQETGSGGGASGKILYNNSTSYMSFVTAQSERMGITATGNVGIGTAGPGTKLEVYGSITSRPASTQDAIIISGRSGGTSSYAITFTPTTLSANQTITFPNSTGTVALQGDTHYIGTTAVTLNRASANLALTGITSVNGITVSGSSGTFALQGDTQYIGTTAVTLNRASANLALTGISSVTLPGSTSGTIQIVPSAVAGTNTQFTLPATSGTAITSGDTGTVTNTMLAGSIANAKLTNSSVTVNGTAIALGASGTVTATATNALTIGSGLSGSSYNGSSPVTISLNTANANTWTATQTFADINVTGTLSVVQTLITAIENPTIDLGGLTGGGAPTSDDNKDRGFTFQWHNGTSAKKGFLGYTDSTSVLSFIPDSTETSGVYSGTYGVAKFGGIQLNLSSVSSNTALDSTYSYVLATGTITVTLPTAVGITGRLYWIKKMDTGTTLTIATTSSQTIDGSSTLTVNTQYASYTLVSNGSNWIIV